MKRGTMPIKAWPFWGCAHLPRGQQVRWRTQCTRTRNTTGSKCERDAAVWPSAHSDIPDPVACWHHLTDEEKVECNRGRRACSSRSEAAQLPPSVLIQRYEAIRKYVETTDHDGVRTRESVLRIMAGELPHGR